MRSEDLQFAIENGIINASDVLHKVEMQRWKKLIEEYPYHIWQGKNGCWYVYLPTEDGGRTLKKRTTEDGIKAVVYQHCYNVSVNPTVREAFKLWQDLRVSEGDIKFSTRDKERNTFRKNLLPWADRKLNSLDAMDWVMFLEASVKKNNLTSKEFANLRGIVKGTLKYAKRRGFIDWNVEAELADVQISRKKYRKVRKRDCGEVFTEDEVNTLVGYLKDRRDARSLCIMLLFVTGMRVGEVVTLTKADLGTDYVTVQRTETRYRDENGKYVWVADSAPKTEAGQRTIAVPNGCEWILEEVKKLDPKSDWAFNHNGRRMKSKNVEDYLYQVCLKTGIKPKSPHKLRKTYATILLDENINFSTIKTQLGHTDIRTTEQFYYKDRKTLNERKSIVSVEGFHVATMST